MEKVNYNHYKSATEVDELCRTFTRQTNAYIWRHHSHSQPTGSKCNCNLFAQFSFWLTVRVSLQMSTFRNWGLVRPTTTTTKPKTYSSYKVRSQTHAICCANLYTFACWRFIMCDAIIVQEFCIIFNELRIDYTISYMLTHERLQFQCTQRARFGRAWTLALERRVSHSLHIIYFKHI